MNSDKNMEPKPWTIHNTRDVKARDAELVRLKTSYENDDARNSGTINTLRADAVRLQVSPLLLESLSFASALPFV